MRRRPYDMRRTFLYRITQKMFPYILAALIAAACIIAVAQSCT